MSPTSSSRFLVGRNARSATARTTLILPAARAPGGRASLCSASTTPWRSRCQQRQPSSSAPGAVLCSSALCRRRRLHLAPALLCALALALVRRRGAPGRERAGGRLQGRGRRGAASRPTRSWPSARTSTITVAQRGDKRTVPNVAVTVRGFDTRLEDPDRGRSHPPRVRDQRRAEGDRHLPGVQGAAPRGRRDRLHRHLGARPARAGPREDLQVERDRGAGRPVPDLLRGGGGARRQGRAVGAGGKAPTGLFSGTVDDAAPTRASARTGAPWSRACASAGRPTAQRFSLSSNPSHSSTGRRGYFG